MVQVIYSYEPLAQRPMTSPESGIGLRDTALIRLC
jgi:hypothetical protein